MCLTLCAWRRSPTGLLPRVFDFIFNQISREGMKNSPITYTCKVSYLEIYQERPFDLLEPDAQNLNIREDPKKGIFCENLQEVLSLLLPLCVIVGS